MSFTRTVHHSVVVLQYFMQYGYFVCSWQDTSQLWTWGQTVSTEPKEQIQMKDKYTDKSLQKKNKHLKVRFTEKKKKRKICTDCTAYVTFESFCFWNNSQPKRVAFFWHGVTSHMRAAAVTLYKPHTELFFNELTYTWVSKRNSQQLK